jgi:hypothetical protein
MLHPVLHQAKVMRPDWQLIGELIGVRITLNQFFRHPSFLPGDKA